MAKYLLDTNIFTCILRKRNETDLRIIQKFQNILRTNARILICPIVFYEVARGLYHKNAQRQLAAFEKLVEGSVWCEFSSETWDAGAQLWANCKQQGIRTGKSEKDIDADVLIAAQTHQQKAILVTNNTKHFQHFNIPCEDWLAEIS